MKRSVAAILIIVLVAGCEKKETTTSPQAQIIVAHHRTDSTRLTDTVVQGGNVYRVLRIRNPSGGGVPPLRENYLYLALFSVRMDLRGGDILEVFAECEVTNDNIYAVQMGSVIAISDQETDMRQAVVDGNYICGLTGMNVTNEIHHLMTTRAGSLTIPSGLSGSKWIHFIGFAISDGRTPGDYLIFERGHLSVLQLRP